MPAAVPLIDNGNFIVDVIVSTDVTAMNTRRFSWAKREARPMKVLHCP